MADSSFLATFANATPVVQAVMAALGAASVAVWSVLAAKIVEFRHRRNQMRLSLLALTQAPSLAEARLASPKECATATALLDIATHELARSAHAHVQQTDGIKERLALRLIRAESQAVRHWQLGLGLLGTVGAVGPFVGLFGTVWGIMNSFNGIAQQHASSLSAVAPGIAEALMATATGLIAAIPAVVAYNVLNRQLGALKSLAEDLGTAVRCLVSLDLERPGATRPILTAAQ